MKTDPKDLREGDRVRITLEGEVKNADSSRYVSIHFDGSDTYDGIERGALSHAEITRLDPPLKEGDAVEYDGNAAKVLATQGDLAWLRWATGGYVTAPISSLTRISEQAQ